jgi:hypothetical protein
LLLRLPRFGTRPDDRNRQNHIEEVNGRVRQSGNYGSRGREMSSLRGRYVFGDYSDGFTARNGRVTFLDESDAADPHDRTPRVFNLINGHTNFFVDGLGEDRRGDVYVLGNEVGIPFFETGLVFKLVEECRTAASAATEPASHAPRPGPGRVLLMFQRRKKGAFLFRLWHFRPSSKR